VYSADNGGQVQKVPLKNVAMDTLHSIFHSTHLARQALKDTTEMSDCCDSDDHFKSALYVGKHQGNPYATVCLTEEAMRLRKQSVRLLGGPDLNGKQKQTNFPIPLGLYEMPRPAVTPLIPQLSYDDSHVKKNLQQQKQQQTTLSPSSEEPVSKPSLSASYVAVNIVVGLAYIIATLSVGAVGAVLVVQWQKVHVQVMHIIHIYRVYCT
jgi:hypothetical protein